MNGALSTDGTFITLTTDTQRTHFVVAMDELPQLNSPLEILPDGSLQIELVLPGGARLLLNVCADAAIDAEKAATLLTSIHRARPTVADAGMQAQAGIAPQESQRLGYQMTGWSEQELASVAQRLRRRGINCGVAGNVLTVPLADEAVADTVISSTPIRSNSVVSRYPKKYHPDGRPLRTPHASNQPQTSPTPPPASRVLAPSPSTRGTTIAPTAAQSNSKKWVLAGVATVVAVAIAIGVATAGGDNSTQTPLNQADEAPSTPCSQLSQIVSELRSGLLNPEQAYNDAYAAADVLDSVRWGVVAGSIRGQANSGFPLQSVSMIQGYITQRC